MNKMHFYHILICKTGIKQKYIVLSVGYCQLLHHFAGEKRQRRLQVCQIPGVDQPQRHRRLKVAEVDDLELVTPRAGRQRRPRHQTQPQSLRHQRHLQLGARALDVKLQAQTLALQLADEPGT